MPFAYEFFGVKFGPRIQDLVPALGAPELVYGERHVPYSDKTVLDIGGWGPRRFATQIKVARLDVPDIMATVGQTGLLIIATIQYENATLLKLANHSMTPMPTITDADLILDGRYHFFDAEWILGAFVSS